MGQSDSKLGRRAIERSGDTVSRVHTDNQREEKAPKTRQDAHTISCGEVDSTPHLPLCRDAQQQTKVYKQNIMMFDEFNLPVIEDPEEELAIKDALKSIAPSFTVIHQRLFNLAIETCSPNEELAVFIPSTGPLTSKHVKAMIAMAEIEFLASLKKELIDPEEKAVHDPVPFDIYLMEPSLFRQSKSLRSQLAVCVPMKKKRGEQGKQMMWYDGRGNLWTMNNPSSHRWKVASLSGTARVLEALMHHPTSLMKWAMARDVIIDSSYVPVDYDPIFTKSLNDSQREAVSTVSSPDFTEGIFCVLGPPGTGKTHTISTMIEAVGKGIIVAAPSNAAVANVALKVHRLSSYNMTDIVVFGQNCDDSVRFLNPLHRSEEFYKFKKSYNRLEDDASKGRKLKEFAAWLHLEDGDIDIANIAQLCPYIDLDERRGRDLYASLLLSASVIFSTLNSSGSNMLTNALQKSFHTYILDEAGQCTESEFYIATNFPGIKRMIVVGDPKQLPSTVIDEKCSMSGYGISWLARTYNQMPKQVHLLNVQYRMDKAILAFPNRQFYDEQIISGDAVIGREPYVANPNLFVDTEGRGREAKNKFSWMNEYEAVVIKSLLNSDDDIVKLRSHSPNTRTIIISPYRAQVCLLTEQLKKVRGVEVTTIDSVQGSEADIVIVSTVRTKIPGFVDDPQRLNVALTRAKRVLRVVGDISFFLSSLMRPSSTLKSLAKHYKVEHLASAAKVRNVAWTSPNWAGKNLWIPTMTSKFYDSIKNMTPYDKNVCFNTVLALSKPDIELILPRPSRRDRPSWYISSLKGYTHKIAVVWIAKSRGPDLLIEAHFAGTRHMCNTFIQRHVKLPVGTCIVSPDLMGVQEMDSTYEEKHETSNLLTSWPLTNPLQNAIMTCSINSLPQGNLVLDPYQQEISVSLPPLLIESRSGTGKTNVLFQHAVIHTQLEQQQCPGCFVTVSPRLCNELRQRYQELCTIQDGDVPDFLFFSRSTLFSGLLAKYRINHVDMENLCSFREYCNDRARTTHTRMTIEERLVENEVGGVIVGSLAAGLKKRPLNRDEYLAEIRSNITNKTELGKARRMNVYDVFEKYQAWKAENDSLDINDVVLLLLNEPNLTQIFDSAYVDECQDFSYASLLLICKIGGYDNIRWIFAGDTAQMISPGCSFTFDGLKQTLLSLQPGIEQRLSKVNHLLVNYRTTKDVLLLGNSILRVAKKNFPLQIAHSQPEVAMKDMGLKIRTFDWDDALELSVRFGHNQAMIHSGDESDTHRGAIIAVHKWLKDHPFILTSLDSKGLEFDDVVVYFSFHRKVWDTMSQREESLRMLRELYVAVTRAKRRVVILLNRKDTAIKCFLGTLECDIEHITDPDQFQVEFDCETSAELWYDKGVELFEEGRYDLAASCFASANSYGHSNWAKGRHLKSLGDIVEAAVAYRRAAKYFVDECNYIWSLDVLQELSYCPPWNPEDNSIFDRARTEAPTHLNRHETLRLCLMADRWESIEIRDLKNTDTSTLFVSYKDHPKLNSMISKCTDADRTEISKVLPSIVAQYHETVQNYTSAVELYISSNEIRFAEESTRKAVEKSSDIHVRGCIKAWSKNTNSFRNLSEESYINLLIRLYQSPMEIAQSAGKKCIQTYGRKLVVFAIESSKLDLTNLHEFDSIEFRTEVNKCLESKFDSCIDIISWYFNKNDYENANEYAMRHCKRPADSEFLNILSLHPKIQLENFMLEIKRRKLGTDAICRLFLPQSRFDLAIEAADFELASLKLREGDKVVKELKELAKSKANVTDLKKGGKFSKLRDRPLFNFLDLCRDPHVALSTKIYSTKCGKFGKDRILKAVSYGGPYYEQDPLVTLANFSPKYYRKLHRYDLFKAFLECGNLETATWYADCYREDWTDNEIMNLVDDIGLTFPICSELLRRGLALPKTLNSRDMQTAIKASSKMLNSPAAAEKNIIDVILLWRNREPTMLDSPEALLKLTNDSTNESRDKMTALLINFGPSVTAFLKMNDFGTKCDAKMLSAIVQHHLELRQHIISVDGKENLPGRLFSSNASRGSGCQDIENYNDSIESQDNKYPDSVLAKEDVGARDGSQGIANTNEIAVPDSIESGNDDNSGSGLTMRETGPHANEAAAPNSTERGNNEHSGSALAKREIETRKGKKKKNRNRKNKRKN